MSADEKYHTDLSSRHWAAAETVAGVGRRSLELTAIIAAESFSRIPRLLGPRGGKSPRLCNVTSLPEASTGTIRCCRCRSGRIPISLQANL